MRRVPHYLIIGNGRVASHFQHYFSLLNLACSSWHRNLPLSSLNQLLPDATHILLLISDQAIDAFISEYLQQSDAIRIHFSGCLISDQAYGAHPLMTFSHHLYDIHKYQALPFVIDHDAPAFTDLLPGLMNPHTRLHKILKPKYHAMCVMGGNFSCMLWQKLFNTFEKEFNIPPEIAHQYLQQQTQNLLQSPQTALTGPLVRNDQLTLQKNMNALENDAFQPIYKSFVECYTQINEVKK
jgi:2-dehydropantoate 2-reductase